MLKVDMEYEKGILYVRLKGVLDRKVCYKINNYVVPVVLKHKVKYLVFNLYELEGIDESGMDALLNVKCAIRTNKGKICLCEVSDFLREKMIKILTDRFKLYNNFTLINEDILKVNLKQLISNNIEIGKAKIVANLPYYITTPIIMKLLEDKLNIESITVMVQKEVADRIVEVPGGKLSGAITYSVNYYAETEEIVLVGKESFIPSPEVDSKVIKLKIRNVPPVNVKNEEMFFKVIKASFMQRRKTLINGLTNSGIIQDKKKLEQIIKQMNLNLEIRGEKLSLEQFAELSNIITESIWKYTNLWYNILCKCFCIEI